MNDSGLAFQQRLSFLLRRLPLPLRLSGQPIPPEQIIHQPRRVVPVVRPEHVAARDELRAGVEHLVLHVAGGEFGAEGVPGELHELHAARGIGGW